MKPRLILICLLVLIGVSLVIPHQAKAEMIRAGESAAVVNTSLYLQPALQTQWWRSGVGILAISVVGSVLVLAGGWFAFGQRLSWWQYGVIGSAAYTGLAHILIGLTYEGEFLLFLDGLGFFGILGALYLPIAAFVGFRPWLRWGLLVYTLIGFVAYFVIHIAHGHFGELALTTKAAEFVLMGLLIGRLRGMGEVTTA